MIGERALRVADAVMYEGAMLYPYRRSSLKNRYRFYFGVLPPRGCGTAAALGGACLLRGAPDTRVEVFLRCLTDDGRELRTHTLTSHSTRGDELVQFHCDAVAAELQLERCRLGNSYERLRACVHNRTELHERGAESAHSLYGVHLLLQVAPGAHFVSMTDPAAEAQPYTAHCEGEGLWCCVLGDERARPDVALLAPIILPDFPQVAPESSLTLGDATEIDELLALRILTLTAAEKRAARASGGWARALLDRVEALTPREILQLHGARRPSGESAGAPVDAQVRAQDRLKGARVVLRPRRSADALDVLLEGRCAVVRGVEHSVDGELLLGVTLTDDPGADLGEAGLPGHRFFFRLDEVELLDEPHEHEGDTS